MQAGAGLQRAACHTPGQTRRVLAAFDDAVQYAASQLFVIGHDCGHRSFSKDKLVEDIVGTVMFAPLVYPFEPWRIKHNHHHAHTNKLVEVRPLSCLPTSGSFAAGLPLLQPSRVFVGVQDTAWHPVMPSDLDKWGDSFAGAVCKVFLGTPLKLWASVGHWALWHFDVNKFTENQRSRVRPTRRRHERWCAPAGRHSDEPFSKWRPPRRCS